MQVFIHDGLLIWIDNLRQFFALQRFMVLIVLISRVCIFSGLTRVLTPQPGQRDYLS